LGRRAGDRHPRRPAISAGARDYVEPPKQICEELLEQGLSRLAVAEFVGAEAEYLVSAELEADIIVGKNPQGPVTTLTVAFQGRYDRFVDIATR
jgi:replicative DNA helicase